MAGPSICLRWFAVAVPPWAALHTRYHVCASGCCALDPSLLFEFVYGMLSLMPCEVRVVIFFAMDSVVGVSST